MNSSPRHVGCFCPKCLFGKSTVVGFSVVAVVIPPVPFRVEKRTLLHSKKLGGAAYAL